MVKEVCIIIPTYNEAQNIGPLLRQIHAVSTSIQDYHCTMVIADDSSPDGTATIVQSLIQELGNIHLLSGPREGMGAAYIRAFSAFLDSCDIIITMDADFSHPPHMIRQLLQKIDSGCDMVIGSRYITGGGTVNWPLQRRLTSTLANYMARYIAGLCSVKDCTSNYRAIRATHLASISFSPLDAGYAFVTTVLWAVHRKGVICEIPLLFHDRKKGKTKLRMKDFLSFFINCFRLRFLSFYAFFRPSTKP